jgi:type IV secretory pathway VirB3-like protein
MTPSNAARPPLEPQRGSSLAGKAYWAMVQRVALTAAAIDAGYILLFLWLGSMPLAAINVLSIAMYLGAYRLIQKRYNTAALALIWLEVIGHSALGSLLIGWESGFHYYLLMFIPAIVIANTRGYAAPMVLALLAYYLGLHMLSDAVGPLDPLPARSVKIVNWVHICVVFAMSAALSAFYRRTILIAEARLRKQATRDPLTGLANRSHFDAQATEALERSQRSGAPVTLLLCDVDHFKSLFKVFLKSHKCLAGMGCKARCTADSPCYRQAPQRRRPPGKALARRVGVKSGR